MVSMLRPVNVYKRKGQHLEGLVLAQECFNGLNGPYRGLFVALVRYGQKEADWRCQRRLQYWGHKR